VSPTAKAVLDRNQRLGVSFRALEGERSVRGENFAWIQAGAPVEVRFSPLFDVADYRKFARETRTDWVIETLPTRVPVVLGRTNGVKVEASNANETEVRVSPELELPPGIVLEEPVELTVGGKSRAEALLRLRVDERVLPPSRHSTKASMKMRAASSGLVSEDLSEVYVLPSLAIPRVATAPGSAVTSDLSRFARGGISHEDLWWRLQPDGPADSSATFFLAYDDLNLYAGIEVRDDVVVCNIAPDDIKAQLRSDAVGITVDPSGASRDTSTVLQAALPCTTEGFAAVDFAMPTRTRAHGKTAPGMEVASRKLDTATPQAKIPGRSCRGSPRPVTRSA
jgi:hypothetical protein